MSLCGLCGLIVFQVNPCLHFRTVCNTVLRRSSPNVPKPGCEHFVGREEDIEIVVKGLYSESTKVISIVGPPGMGKSTLAKYIGHEMILHFFIVHYVNMAEFPDYNLKKALAEKIYQSLPGATPANATFRDLLLWAYSLPAHGFNHLIILDNCDSAINNQREEFQEAVQDVIDISSYVKFLTTSQEEMVFLNVAPLVHKVKPLSENSAHKLLDHKTSSGLLSDAEKKQIAELTGKIPLALQIINSLLNVKLKPPSPAEVIAELEKNPISTLSDPKLTSVGQLNISISISYDYLSINLQKTIRHIALFQGPFREYDAIAMLRGYNRNVSEDLLRKFLGELVMRSLIEYDDETGMYQFHKLIRDFFLTQNTEADRDVFDAIFYLYYGQAVCSLNELYLKSPRGALATLHQERCHLKHFMSTFRIPDKQYVIGGKPWQCFDNALRLGYLRILFSLDDLIKPLKNIRESMETWVVDREDTKKQLVKSLVLVNSIEHLGHFTELKHGRDQAVQQFMWRVDVIESLPMQEEVYADFYFQFLRYEPELGEEKVKLYHERLLHKLKHSELSCHLGMCSYYEIGIAHFKLRNYDKSITFLEKSIHGEEFANFSTLVKVRSLLCLRQAYSMAAVREIISNTSHISMNLLNMFPSMVNSTSSIVYLNLLVFHDYMQFLHNASEPHKMRAIQEKILGTLYRFGVKGDVKTVLSSYGLARHFYQGKEYRRVINIALYALECLEAVQQKVTMTREKVDIHMILSESLYHLGFSALANNFFTNITELLLTMDLRDHFYYQNFVLSCSYLVKLGNFAYFSTCSSSILFSSLYRPSDVDPVKIP